MPIVLAHPLPMEKLVLLPTIQHPAWGLAHSRYPVTVYWLFTD